jgi:predicted site-specific integrase-resolvase
MMSKFVPITVAANALGVSATTLRRWEAAGRLVPDRTVGGQRRDDLAALRPELAHGAPAPRRTVAYARVPSHDQKGNLERQKQVLELEIITAFSARLYGARSHKNRKLIDGVRRVVQEAQC